MLKDIKVWKGRHTKQGRECRIYIHTTDDREGCLYLTGNPWHKKGSVEGQLTDAEWQEARKIAIRDGKWHTVYENEMPHSVKPQVSSKQRKSHSTPKPMTNRQGQHCAACGEWVKPGQGELVHLTDEEDIDFIGQGKEWLVYHKDKALCKANQARAETEKQKQAQRKVDRRNEADKLACQVKKATDLDEKQDWSWDDYRYSLGETLAQTAYFVAREYLDGKEIIGFAIKERK